MWRSSIHLKAKYDLICLVSREIVKEVYRKGREKTPTDQGIEQRGMNARTDQGIEVHTAKKGYSKPVVTELLEPGVPNEVTLIV